MKINQREEEGVVCFQIEGRLDAESAIEAEARVKETLAQNRSRLLFDFSRLEYISSAGLRVVLMAVKAARAKNGKVVLCALTPYVKEVFDVSNFSSIIPITDSVEAGLAQMR